MSALNQPVVINTATHPNYRILPNRNLQRRIHEEERVFRAEDRQNYINKMFARHNITDYSDKSTILSSNELNFYINARDNKMIDLFIDTYINFRYHKHQSPHYSASAALDVLREEEENRQMWASAKSCFNSASSKACRLLGIGKNRTRHKGGKRSRRTRKYQKHKH